MLEDLKDGLHDLRVIAEDSKSFLCAPSEHAFGLCHTKPINDVVGQAEWYTLGDRKELTLLNGKE